MAPWTTPNCRWPATGALAITLVSIFIYNIEAFKFKMFHFSSRFRRTFKSPICSCASCFSLFFLIAAIFAPLFFAYFSGGFWINVEVKNLKPQVSLTKDLLLFLTDASTGKSYSFSTIKDRYEANTNDLGVPIIKLFTQDNNLDGQSDLFNL